MAHKGQPVPSTIHRHGHFKVSDGKSVRVTAPPNSGDIKVGQICLFDGFLGIAVRGEDPIQRVKPGNVLDNSDKPQTLILTIEQAEYETDQVDSEDTMLIGTELYWDPVEKRLTEKSNDGAGYFYRKVGRVTQTKDDNDVIWFLLYPQVEVTGTDTDNGGGEGDNGGEG